jgi:ubiquinone/menaquinone biosynthesis C-methylase UbiE
MSSNQPQTQQRQQIQSAWDSVAAGYDEFVTPSHYALASEALSHVDLKPGMRFLDVAAGSGALGLTAARLGADAIATDISPRMIELLDARAREEGFSSLESRVMDGHALEFEDDSFDCSGSMFGVMLFPDLPRGLSEMVRVTRPGGQVVVITFGPPQGMEFLAFFLKAARQVVPDFTGLPMDPPPLPFQVANPAKLEQEFVKAGATDITVHTTTETLEFTSAAHLWKWVANSNPIGATLTASLSAEQSATVQQVLDDMLRERSGGSGPARLTNPINIAVGTA